MLAIERVSLTFVNHLGKTYTCRCLRPPRTPEGPGAFGLSLLNHFQKTYTSSDSEHVSLRNPAGSRRAHALSFLNHFLKTYICLDAELIPSRTLAIFNLSFINHLGKTYISSDSEHISPGSGQLRRSHALSFLNHFLKTYTYSDTEPITSLALAMFNLSFVNHLGKTYTCTDCERVPPGPRPPRPAQRLRPSPP